MKYLIFSIYVIECFLVLVVWTVWALLAFGISTENSGIILIALLLYVTSSFSFAVFVLPQGSWGLNLGGQAKRQVPVHQSVFSIRKEKGRACDYEMMFGHGNTS